MPGTVLDTRPRRRIEVRRGGRAGTPWLALAQAQPQGRGLEEGRSYVGQEWRKEETGKNQGKGARGRENDTVAHT